MFTLDKLDRKILFELDCDSRQSISQLSRRLKQARDTVEYRVQRLQREGVIQRFTIVVNPMRMGLTIFNVYLRLAANREERQSLLKYLQSSKGVYWIAECAGQWDLIFAVAVRRNNEFYDAHAELLSRFSSLILESAIHTLVDIWLCAKDYILNEPSGRKTNLAQAESDERLDAKDLKLLRILTDNARTSATDISEQIGLSVEATLSRIERLHKTGVIAGSRIELDLDQLNKQHFKAQFFFNRFTKDTEKTFREFCLSQTNVTCYLQVIGPCPVELEIEVKSYRRYHEILDELRAAAPGMIRNIHTILIRRAQQTAGLLSSALAELK